MIDLTWTGNIHLDKGYHNNLISSSSSAVDFSLKGDAKSDNVSNALAKYYNLEAGFFQVGAGATQLLDRIITDNQPKRIFEIVPNFHLVRTISIERGYDYTPIEISEHDSIIDKLPIESFDEASILLFSSPRNPLGYAFSIKEIERVLKKSNGIVVVDQVYAEFYDDELMSFIGEYKNLVIVRTFSKAWGLANLRIGYAVSSGFGEKTKISLLPNSVNGFAQNIAIELLSNSDHISESLSKIAKLREELETELSKLDQIEILKSSANFVCFTSVHAKKIVERLLDKGIKLRRLHDLKYYPSHWPEGVRISVPEQQLCFAIVSEIKQLFSDSASVTNGE